MPCFPLKPVIFYLIFAWINWRHLKNERFTVKVFPIKVDPSLKLLFAMIPSHVTGHSVSRPVFVAADQADEKLVLVMFVLALHVHRELV